MNKSIEAVRLNWEVLGMTLATLTSNEQSAFFTGFIKEVQKYPTKSQAEMQMCYINSEIAETTKKTMEELFPALWVK